MRIKVDSKVRLNFPDFEILSVIIKDLNVRGEDRRLEALKEDTIQKIRGKYNIESLRDIPSIRAYRNFFWRVGIDPTKNRPAAEALIRRVLLGNPLPKINTFVDSMNLASVLSEVAIASFDLRTVLGEPVIRYAARGETFQGIGMEKPILLEGKEIIIADGAGVIAIYPHRDSDRTKITENTRSALLIFCGVPGVDSNMLRDAMDRAINLITNFCGGSSLPVEVE